MDSWTQMHMPLCHVTISHGSLEPKIEDGHVVVDFANKMIGGGVLFGGNVQEEIMFSKRPETMTACLLCETMYVGGPLPAVILCNILTMYKTECVVVYGARWFAETEGYGSTFTFSRAAPSPALLATTTIFGHLVAATAGLNSKILLERTRHSQLRFVQTAAGTNNRKQHSSFSFKHHIPYHAFPLLISTLSPPSL
jgi:hypothetical protein